MPISTNTESYTCPMATSPESDRLSWVKRVIHEGDAFFRTQTAYSKIPRAISTILGDAESQFPKGRSAVQANFTRRLVHEIIAALSNIRPIQGCVTYNSQFDDQTEIVNKITQSHYTTHRVDRILKRWLQWAAISTGWLVCTWQRSLGPYGLGDIHLEAKGPFKCWPIQLPEDGNYQNAYAFVIQNELPLHLAHSIWGASNPAIVPDATPSFFRHPLKTIRRFASPLLNAVANKSISESINFQIVNIYDIYILDLSINDTSAPIQIGEFDSQGNPRNSWSYTVPYLGQPLPTGIHVPTGTWTDGKPDMVEATRPAEPEDCLLYPSRRLITTTEHGILRDGPSYYLHGRVPAVKLCLDPWFEFLGNPLTESESLQRAYNEILRGVVDNVNCSLDPPLGYTTGTISESTEKRLSLRTPGLRIPKNTPPGVKLFETLVDPQYYNINSAIPMVMEKLQSLMEYFLDTNNMKALAQARQLPAADTVEALNNMAGAITTDRSLEVEAAIEELGSLMTPLIFQFYTAPRRLFLLGPDGLTKQDFDFHPDTLTPAPSSTATPANYTARSRSHLKNFFFRIESGSLHDLTSQTQRMTQLQLRRSGAPLSWHTIMESCKVQNIGRLPGDPTTEIEKFLSEQQMMAEAAAQIQQALSPPQPQESLPPELLSQLSAALQGNGGNPGPGRKPTGAQPPHLLTRRDGSTSVAESR